MNKIMVIALFFVLGGCAFTYAPPVGVSLVASGDVDASREKIVAAAVAALNDAGYQISYADKVAGIVQTAPKPLKVTPAQADCGTTAGLDYLKDARTKTEVAYNIEARNGSLVVKSVVRGEYRPGRVDQDITLTCISRGTLEQDLLNSVRAKLKG